MKFDGLIRNVADSTKFGMDALLRYAPRFGQSYNSLISLQIAPDPIQNIFCGRWIFFDAMTWRKEVQGSIIQLQRPFEHGLSTLSMALQI